MIFFLLLKGEKEVTFIVWKSVQLYQFIVVFSSSSQVLKRRHFYCEEKCATVFRCFFLLLLKGLKEDTFILWKSRVGNLQKNEHIMSECAICSKNERFAHLVIFGVRPELFAHGHSFLVSDLSNLLTLLSFGERPERFAHIDH